MQEFTYLTAFAVGLMGGVHCIGMCGGIVGALSFGLRQQHVSSASASAISGLLIAYNVGRLLSYGVAGGLMGGVGWMAANWLEVRQLQLILQMIAGVFMILLGLYLAGWWMLLSRVEKVGAGLWQIIGPMAKKMLPVRNIRQALMLGILWGWLPCGLVYSVLIWSISAGGFVEGSLLMLSFGLGTLPNLLAMGFFAGRLQGWVSHAGFRRIAGGLVIGFGLWTLFIALKT